MASPSSTNLPVLVDLTNMQPVEDDSSIKNPEEVHEITESLAQDETFIKSSDENDGNITSSGKDDLTLKSSDKNDQDTKHCDKDELNIKSSERQDQSDTKSNQDEPILVSSHKDGRSHSTSLSPSDPDFDHDIIFLQNLDEDFELSTDPITPDDAPTRTSDDSDHFNQNTDLLTSLIQWDVVHQKLPPGMNFTVEELTVQQILNLLNRSEQRRHTQLCEERIGRAVYPGLERRAAYRRASHTWTPNLPIPTFENGPDAPYSLRDEVKPALTNTDEDDNDHDWNDRFNVDDQLLDQVLEAGEGSVKSLAVLNYIGFMFERYLPSHCDKSLHATETKANILDVIHGVYEANEIFGEEVDDSEDFFNSHDSLTPLFGNVNEIRGFGKKMELTGKIGFGLTIRPPNTPLTLEPPSAGGIGQRLVFSGTPRSDGAGPMQKIVERSTSSSQSIPESRTADLTYNHEQTASEALTDLTNQNERSVLLPAVSNDESLLSADSNGYRIPLPGPSASGFSNQVPSSSMDGRLQQQAQHNVGLTINTTLAQSQRRGAVPQARLGPSTQPGPSRVASTLLHNEQHVTRDQEHPSWSFGRMAAQTAASETLAKDEDPNLSHNVQGLEVPQWSAAFLQYEKEQLQLEISQLRGNISILGVQHGMLSQANLALANQNTVLIAQLVNSHTRELGLAASLQTEAVQKQEWEAKCKQLENDAPALGTEKPTEGN